MLSPRNPKLDLSPKAKSNPNLYSQPFRLKPLVFITDEESRKIASKYPLPLLLYNPSSLEEKLSEIKALPQGQGCLIRYAIKANPSKAIIRFFDKGGLHFDASSHWEVERLLHYGVSGKKILLTSQEQAPDPIALLKKGVLLNASSLHQLNAYASAIRKSLPKNRKHTQPPELSLRVNPGLQTSAQKKINVSGPDSSFGIWHELLPDALLLAKRHGVRLTRLHLHLSSSTLPEEWLMIMEKTLPRLIRQLPDIHTCNLGGGFAIARTHGERRSKLKAIVPAVQRLLKQLTKQTGRPLKLELEPGTYLVAESSLMMARVEDIVRTTTTKPLTRNGLRKETFFVKLNTGMNALIRPALYHATHTLKAVSQQKGVLKRSDPLLHSDLPKNVRATVVGHCCEQGDILAEQTLGPLRIGDIVLITAVGAYGSAQASNYNSFPHLAEYWLTRSGPSLKLRLIRREQTIEDMTAQEI